MKKTLTNIVGIILLVILISSVYSQAESTAQQTTVTVKVSYGTMRDLREQVRLEIVDRGGRQNQEGARYGPTRDALVKTGYCFFGCEVTLTTEQADLLSNVLERRAYSTYVNPTDPAEAPPQIFTLTQPDGTTTKTTVAGYRTQTTAATQQTEDTDDSGYGRASFNGLSSKASPQDDTNVAHDPPAGTVCTQCGCA